MPRRLLPRVNNSTGECRAVRESRSVTRPVKFARGKLIVGSNSDESPKYALSGKRFGERRVGERERKGAALSRLRENDKKRVEGLFEQVTMLLRREILRLSPAIGGQRR